MEIAFTPPTPPFLGATALDAPPAAGFDAVLFGAPHGTPYAGIDNTVFEGTAPAIRGAHGDEMDWTTHWNYDFDGLPLGPDGSFRVGDLGDLPTVWWDGPRNRTLIEQTTRGLLAGGAIPLMLGGDDSTPIPFIAGFEGRGPLTILQIDAHIDWRDARRGEPLGYSSTMRRASEMPHVERIVQVGQRGFGSARREEIEIARAWGAENVRAAVVHEQGIEAALRPIPEGSDILVTFDCDALDNGAMPAVVIASPGGLTYAQVAGLVTGAAAKGRIVGFDMMEFVPGKDRDGTATFTAASLLAHVVGTLANAAG